jgi:ubiquinone/menaquinone biosynthesis C-methylase UbiE
VIREEAPSVPSPRLVDYDRNSSLYDQRHGSRMPADEALRLVEAAGLGPGARVLEVGAGTGRVSLAFAERGLSVVAVDRSLAMLRELRRKDSRGLVAAVRGDADRLPVTKARVEAVVIARLCTWCQTGRRCSRRRCARSAAEADCFTSGPMERRTSRG